MREGFNKRPLAVFGAILALMIVPLVGPGCGSSEPGLVPVQGRVTLDGGPWPAEGHLNLVPIGDTESSDSYRPASAPFDTNGDFVVSSFQTGDGLFPGTYQVAVECWVVEPSIADDGQFIPGETPVPERYQSPATSGLTLVVEPSGALNTEFDIPSS